MSAPLAQPEAQVLDGKYALIRELGSGGAGTVYEAEHLIVGKRVAVKVLNAGVAGDPEFRARFVAEARAAARIAHANVVDIHDLGVTPDGVPYLVMELLDGETLAEMVSARGALAPGVACEIVLQLLAGLAAAHAKGIVHCDLKPANVIVTHPRPERPLVKVLDFGVARTLTDAAQPNATHALGTPMFMAPEQVCGQPIDERTDLYSACAILYVLVTGREPFVGRSSREVLEQVARGALRPVRSANPRVPEELATLIETGMSRKRKERIHSADALAQRLRAFVEPEASRAPASAMREKPQRAVPLLQPLQRLTQAPSEMPTSSVVRVDVTPRLVTDSLLMDPRLPKPPAPPKLEMGRDFMPLLGDPERNGALDQRALSTRGPAPRKKSGIVPALMAMAVGFGSGVLLAWAAGLI